MTQQIYLIAIVKNGEEKIDDFQAYSSKEKAEKWIFDSAKDFADRQVKKDKKMTCDYIVSDGKGNYIHTLRIKKIWLR